MRFTSFQSSDVSKITVSPDTIIGLHVWYTISFFFLTVEGLHLMPLFFHPLASCLGEFERVWLTIFTSILSCLGKQTYFLRYSPRLLSSLCSKLIFLLISATEYLETKFHDYFPLAWRSFLEINLMEKSG